LSVLYRLEFAADDWRGDAAKIVNMRRQPLLRDAVIASDLVLADGMAVVWASRLLRRPVPGAGCWD